MNKYLPYALIIGIFGMLLMILVSALRLELIHPFVLPVLLIFAVALSSVVLTFKLSEGLSVRVVTSRVLQATMFSTVITNLLFLFITGYYFLLRQQHPGILYRDQVEVAFDVFLFMTLIGLVISGVLSLVTYHFANRRFSPTIVENDLMISEVMRGG